MVLRGGCACGNISVHWHTVDFSLVPRACQCDYCIARKAAWVSKTGTAVDIKVQRPGSYRIVRQGSEIAEFHECAGCGVVVAVTVNLGDECLGALNASRIDNPLGFGVPVEVNPSALDPEAKLSRWRDNWCRPVRLSIAQSAGKSAEPT